MKHTTCYKLIAFVSILSLFLLTPISTHAAFPDAAEYHTVQPGETWGSIAAYYGTAVESIWKTNGVVNPSLLREGMRLFIPEIGQFVGAEVLSFDPGTSVWKTALRTGSSLSTIMLVNGLSNPFAAQSQRLYMPNYQASIVLVPSTPVASDITSTPTADSQPTPLPLTPGNAIITARAGIQGHFSIPDDDRHRVLDMIAYELEFDWVKVQVDWSKIEYAPGMYSVELEQLDLFMDDAFNRQLNILLSIVKAPDWARNTTEEDGPPVDYNLYNEFVKFIVLRYKYKLTAVEIWNEPNLSREWRGGTLSGAEYVRLLAGAYETVKREDGRILVISAGLAPTGTTNDIAIDDRLYLRQMYDAGLGNYVDAVGIHPYGWANPPQIRCCNDPNGPPTHNDHPSFFFLDTIEDYRDIQTEYGDSDHPLWATEFGWGSMDGLGLEVTAEQPFIAYVNQDQQAQYIREAYLMAQNWDFMGPMFLWNLNVATLDGFDINQAAYSILRDIEHPRPAYNALRDMPKIQEE